MQKLYFTLFLFYFYLNQILTLEYLQSQGNYGYDLDYKETNSAGNSYILYKYYSDNYNHKLRKKIFVLNNENYEKDDFVVQVKFKPTYKSYYETIPGDYYPMLVIYPLDSPSDELSDQEIYDEITKPSALRKAGDYLQSENDPYYFDAFGFRSLFGYQHFQFPYKVGKYIARVINVGQYQCQLSTYQIGFNKYTQCYGECSECDYVNKICLCDITYEGAVCSYQAKQLETNKEYSAYLIQHEWSIFKFTPAFNEYYTLEVVDPPKQSQIYTYLINDFTVDNYYLEPNLHNTSILKNVGSEDIEGYSDKFFQTFRGEKFQRYVHECLRRNILPLVGIGIHTQNPQSKVALSFRIRAFDIEDDSFNYSFLIVLGTMSFIVFLFIIIYCCQKSNKPNSTNQIQLNNGPQQNPQNRPQQPQKEFVCITQESIQKFMPRFNYEIIQQYFPHYQEYFSSDCTVCLCEFEKQEKVRLTVCMHVFHTECIDPWLKKHGKCPFCREKLMSKTFKDYDYLKSKYETNDYIKRILSEQKLNRTPLREMKAFDFLFLDDDKFMLQSRKQYNELQNSRNQQKLIKDQNSLENSDNTKNDTKSPKNNPNLEQSIPTPQPMQNSNKLLIQSSQKKRRSSQDSIQSPEENYQSNRQLQLKPSRFAQLQQDLNIDTNSPEISKKDLFNSPNPNPTLPLTQQEENKDKEDDEEEEHKNYTFQNQNQNQIYQDEPGYYQYSVQDEQYDVRSRNASSIYQVSVQEGTNDKPTKTKNPNIKTLLRQQTRKGRQSQGQSTQGTPQKTSNSQFNFDEQQLDNDGQQISIQNQNQNESDVNSSQKLRDTASSFKSKGKRKRNFQQLTIEKPESKYAEFKPQVQQQQQQQEFQNSNQDLQNIQLDQQQSSDNKLNSIDNQNQNQDINVQNLDLQQNNTLQNVNNNNNDNNDQENLDQENEIIEFEE